MNKYYERYWKREEVLSDFSYKWPAIKGFIPKEKNISLLDFGCGKGYILKEILKLNKTIQVSGVDISDEALKFNKKLFPKKDFRKVEDGGKIPFKSNTFDFITALDVLEHVYDTENAFSELARVLKPNGSILITVPYNGFLKSLIISLLYFEYIFDPYSPHIRHFTKKSMTRCLQKVGLKPHKTGYYGRFYPLSSGMFFLVKK